MQVIRQCNITIHNQKILVKKTQGTSHKKKRKSPATYLHGVRLCKKNAYLFLRVFWITPG